MSHASRLLIALLMLAPEAALAHSFKKDGIVVGHPWARATPAGAAVGAGYAKITNNGTAPDRLVGGTFDGAGGVEIHETLKEGDVVKMRHLKDGLEIKPGATVELRPDGGHLMITGLSKPIATGPDLKGTLVFEKAGAVGVEFRIEPIGAADSHDHKH